MDTTERVALTEIKHSGVTLYHRVDRMRFLVGTGHLVSIFAITGVFLLPAAANGLQHLGPARAAPPLIVLVQGERNSPAPSGQIGVLTGQWRWAATCERGHFSGVMHLVQVGNEFTG